MKKLLLTILLSGTCTISFSQTGSLDPSFGNGGKFIVDFSSMITGANSIAIQSDGKLVAGGFNQNAGRDVFTLVRINSNGTLDNTFDGDGKVTTTLDFIADAIFSIAIQSDGKIVAGGYSIGLNGFRFALARYNSNGSLDNGFDGDGIVITDVGAASAIIYSIALQPDGKIVTAGFSDDGNKHNIALARYNSNGTLDNSFDGDGIVSTSVGVSDDTAFAVLVLPGGKIIVAGASNNGSNTDVVLARYNSNGSLDNSFDGDGKLTTAIGTSDDLAYSVALQADGKIIAAGSSSNGTYLDFALVRYNTNGSPDNGFDGDGKLTTTIGAFNEQAHAVALQADGKIIAAGTSQDNVLNMNFALVRYNTNGSLDNSFDGDGKVTTDITGNNELGVAIKLSGLRIYVAGISFSGEGFVFAAYQNDVLALPLQFIKFTGARKNNQVFLNWQTTAEQNSNYFSIERSSDGKQFTIIGKVNAAGNNNTIKDYSFTDGAPGSGINYYRLRQVDKDEKFNYSPVIKIVNDISELIFSLSPNPASNFINITYPGKKEVVTIIIYDAQGKLLRQQALKNELPIKVEVKHLEPGMYFIQLTDGETVKKARFMKQ